MNISKGEKDGKKIEKKKNSMKKSQTILQTSIDDKEDNIRNSS